MAGPSGNETNHLLDGLTVRGGFALEGDAGVKTYLNRDNAAFAARQAALMRGQGVYQETYPTLTTTAQTIMATQSIYGLSVGLLAGDVVTNMSIRLAISGSTVTLAKAGLYSKTGNTLLTSSADGSALMNAAAGVKSFPMSTPYTVPADDLYYACILAVSAVTMPTLFRVNAFLAAAPMAGVGAGAPSVVFQAAQTDFPATATLATSSSAAAFWIGIS